MLVPRILVIAGSDSSGGAGLEADQRVIAVHGCYAMTATTALTAQNTLGVHDIHITPPTFVEKQIDACLSDIGADVVKIGMLASVKTIDVVARRLAQYKVEHVVLDPVMVSTSGAQLLPSLAVGELCARLLPMISILTPNLPEALLLLRNTDITVHDPTSLDDLKSLAKLVQRLGPKAVLLKGGHIPLSKSYSKPREGEEPALIVNVFFDGHEFTILESAYLKSKNTHGTGCSLASSIASHLARGAPVLTAVRAACHYVDAGIKTGQDMGAGSGPINHFHSLQVLPFPPGGFIDYVIERADIRNLWQNYTHHKFVQQMGNGTLPVELFKSYLIQDYLYLTHFARAHALAAYKSNSMETIAASAQIIVHIEREMAMHLDYCAEFGLSRTEIESHRESQACVAYSRWMLDIGQSQDWLALQVTLAPCLIGYNVAAQWVNNAPESKKEGNKYWKWVENYLHPDYEEAVKSGSSVLESYIVKQSPHRVEELVQLFILAIAMEVRFWDFEAHSSLK